MREKRKNKIKNEGRYVSPVMNAWIYAGLNDDDNTILYLTEGYKKHAHRMDFFTWSFIFTTVSDDPRFQDLIEKMNLELWSVKTI